MVSRAWKSLGQAVVAGVALVGAREWLARRPVPRRNQNGFPGVVYRVGNTAIAEKRSMSPRATVICVHGFSTNFHYFTEHYTNPDIQLILLSACNYHVPINEPRYVVTDWARTPTAPEASINYDAAVLVQSLENCPRTDNIRVHGHSRGGAVVLEAAAMRPDLFRDVEVILEAPALPQARQRLPVSRFSLWFLPFQVPLWQGAATLIGKLQSLTPTDTPRKRKLLACMPFNPRDVQTMMANLYDIGLWMKRRDTSIFNNVKQGTILLSMNDRVLYPRSSLRSAKQAGPNIKLIKLEKPSHFILLDLPEAIPQLPGLPGTEQRSGRGVIESNLASPG